MTQVLIIKAKRDGYRRCGRGFSSTTATEIPVSELSAEEIERLKNDAGLVVAEGTAGTGDAVSAKAGSAFAEIKARADGLQEELQKHVAENAKLESRIAELEEQLKTLTAEKETVGQEANRLAGELVEAKKEKADLEKQLKAAGKKNQ